MRTMRTMTRSWAILLAALLTIVLGGLYFLKPDLIGAGHVPAGQPPLVELNSQAATLQAEFNRTSDHVRVLLLLSPT